MSMPIDKAEQDRMKKRVVQLMCEAAVAGLSLSAAQERAASEGIPRAIVKLVQAELGIFEKMHR